MMDVDVSIVAIATSKGWSPQLVQPCPKCGIVSVDPKDIYSRGWPVEFFCVGCSTTRSGNCYHGNFTDGGVDCDGCGMKAEYFEKSALAWIE